MTRLHHPQPRLIAGAHGRARELGKIKYTRYELGEDEPLAPSHIDVLRRIAQGQENLEIAAARYTSIHTVKRQVQQILERLHARNRAHAVAIGYRRGILS